jgi:hypothetical protein
LNVDVRGRLFLFNNFRFFREEKNTGFRPTPPTLTYRDAVQSLLVASPPSPETVPDQPKPKSHRPH